MDPLTHSGTDDALARRFSPFQHAGLAVLLERCPMHRLTAMNLCLVATSPYPSGEEVWRAAISDVVDGISNLFSDFSRELSLVMEGLPPLGFLPVSRKESYHAGDMLVEFLSETNKASQGQGLESIADTWLDRLIPLIVDAEKCENVCSPWLQNLVASSAYGWASASWRARWNAVCLSRALPCVAKGRPRHQL